MPGFLTPSLAPAEFGSLEKELGEELCEWSKDDNDDVDDGKDVGFPRPGREDFIKSITWLSNGSALGDCVLDNVLDKTVTGIKNGSVLISVSAGAPR